MVQINTIHIDVPKPLIDQLHLLVKEGSYQSIDEIVLRGLQKLLYGDEPFDSWLTQNIIDAAEEIDQGKVKTLSISELKTELSLI